MELFSKAFLKGHLADSRAGHIPDLAHKKIVIGNWIKFLESGKAANSKEENHKSRFLTDVFGVVLGYNYSNVGKWLMQEELKTAVDGTKPDAAFGFFVFEDRVMTNDVRMVIEFKKSGIVLDEMQADRKAKISPVDQAFLYASKMEGTCQWVVVSNLEEIRFYHYSSQLYYQRYRFIDLANEEILREMVYLFQATHLIHKDVSVTEKLYRKSRSVVAHNLPENKHIVDELYDLLQKFDGLHFIDPEYLCTLYPFNVLGEKVWHYNRYHLATLNPAIGDFLKGITISGNEITLLPEYAEEVASSCVGNAENKAEFIVRRLNNCLILGITVIEDKETWLKSNQHILGFSQKHVYGQVPKHGYFKDIQLKKVQNCHCIVCSYRKLDFSSLIEKVKELSRTGSPDEAAYGHYLLCSFNTRETYDQLKKQELLTKGKDDRLPEYFISKFNQWNCYQLLTGMIPDNTADIKAEIKSIDLDTVIANEIDIYADPAVRNYLLQLKEERIIKRIAKEVDEIVKTTRQIRDLLSNEGGYHGSDRLDRLRHLQAVLYYHSHKNYLMVDAFDEFRKLHEQIFQAYLHSYQTPGFGLVKFDSFTLIEALIHVKPKQLSAQLIKVKRLKTTAQAKAALLAAANNILSSYVSAGIFKPGKQELLSAQLLNYRFEKKYVALVENVFLLLTRIKYNNEELALLIQLIIRFLKVEDIGDTGHVTAMADFITRFGSIFTVAQLKEVLNIAVEKHRFGIWTYQSLIKATCRGWAKHYPGIKLQDNRIVQLAILNSSGEHWSDLKHILPLWKIMDDAGKQLLIKALDKDLSQQFSEVLYYELLHQQIFGPDYGNYMEQLAQAVNHQKSPEGFYEQDGRKYTDYTVYNFCIIVHKFGIDPQSDALKPLKNLTLFQQWLLAPKNFDYDNFEVEWLLNANNPNILFGMKGIPKIKEALKEYLDIKYEPTLAKIYFKYL
jgi:hypothetical protein